MMKTQLQNYDIKSTHGSCQRSSMPAFMDSSSINYNSNKDILPSNNHNKRNSSSEPILNEKESPSKKTKISEGLSSVSKFVRDNPRNNNNNERFQIPNNENKVIHEDKYGVIPEDFFIQEDFIIRNTMNDNTNLSPETNKSSGSVDRDEFLQDIELELFMINDSIDQIINSDIDLDISHLNKLNELRRKKRKLLQRKTELEDSLLQTPSNISLDTPFTSSNSTTIEEEPSKTQETIQENDNNNSNKSTENPLPSSSQSKLDIILDDFDMSEEDFLDIDIDNIEQNRKPKNEETHPQVEDELQSYFTKIPSKGSLQIEQYDPWTAQKSKWAKHFEWSDRISKLNTDVFGHHGYRVNQREIINAVMSKKDVFVTMPTGGGKSLCYQLPALYSSLITIVIEPLISLMEDQVMILKGLNVNAEFIGTGQDDEESIIKDLESPKPQLKILYITPEKLMLCERTMKVIKSLYERNLINIFVIDECHCVSQWGHEFRPQYKKLSILKEQFPRIPILALTATATPSVKTDILDVLKLRTSNLVCFTSSFNRPNLFYEIRKKSHKTIVDDIKDYINRYHPKGSGIIYCLAKQDCETLSNELKQKGFKCEYYHASLSTEERMEVQHRWNSGDLQFICATVAFGMGINKPDVRFVIHHSLPKSLEGFYQESGRAGRDGKSASCVLFLSMKDKMRIENMLHKTYRESNETDEKMPYQVLKTNLDRLREMVAFCDNDVDCRRKLIMEYFGEFQNSKKNIKCGMCDNCKNASPIERRDMTHMAILVIKMVEVLEKMGERKTKTTIIDILKGKEKFSNRFGRYEWFGSFRHTDISSIDRLINRMVIEKVLEEVHSTNMYGVVTSLKLGKRMYIDPILKSEKKMIFGFRTKSPMKGERKQLGIDRAKQGMTILDIMQKHALTVEEEKKEELKSKLITELMRLREQIHKEEQSIINYKTSIEMLFPTSLISEIANKLPTTLEEFEKVEGVGKMKAEKYAARFILVILTFIKENPKLIGKQEGQKTNLKKDVMEIEKEVKNDDDVFKKALDNMHRHINDDKDRSIRKKIDFDKYKYT